MKIHLGVCFFFFKSTPYKNKVAFKDQDYLGKCQIEPYNSKLMLSCSEQEELKAASKTMNNFHFFSIQLLSCG